VTELAELVEIGAIVSDNSCPFPHYKRKKRNLKNKWDNNSSTLGENLEGASAEGEKLYLKHVESVTIATGASGRKNYTASYNPHHLLPGEASWPQTKLKRWMDEADGDVEEDIGYDVNCYQNGIDLPSNNEMRGNWKIEDGRTPDFQVRYAFAAMDAAGRRRQFHDSHKAYSDFAVKVLDKISAKLDNQESMGGLGCSDEDCVGKKAKKKYPTPFGLLSRVHASSKRLAGFLMGDARKWKMPIMTSKFSLMYKDRRLTHDEARDLLDPEAWQQRY